MNTPRNDRYLELIKRDLQLRASDTDISEKFRWSESFERELFTHLTAAVKLSHEKEQVYATTTKYWSVLASIIGTFLSFDLEENHLKRSLSLQELCWEC